MKPGHKCAHIITYPDTPSLPLYKVAVRSRFNVTGETCQVVRFRADRGSELTDMMGSELTWIGSQLTSSKMQTTPVVFYVFPFVVYLNW